jgi:ketosteroid isomerase-like protein
MTTAIDDVLTSWVDAELWGDAEALDVLFTDDFVGIGPVGFVLPTAAWVDRFEHGLHYAALSLDEVNTRTYRETAVVVAHQHADGDHHGNPAPADLRLSITPVRDGPAWRIAGIHHSFIARTPGAAA